MGRKTGVVGRKGRERLRMHQGKAARKVEGIIVS